MLSRTADHLFWMARYTERAENTARMLDVNIQTALLPQSAGATEQGWRAVLGISELQDFFDEQYEVVTARNVLDFMMRDPANPSSIASCLKAARENARAVRGVLTTEVWETANATWLDTPQKLNDSVLQQDPGRFFEWVKYRSHLSRGVTIGTMLKDEALHFIRLGTFLERADNTARILDVKFHSANQTAMRDQAAITDRVATAGEAGTSRAAVTSQAEYAAALRESPVDFYYWAAILRSVSAFEVYRRVYRDVITPERVVQLLMLRADMPRSLLACMNGLLENLREVRNDTSSATERCAGKMQAALTFDSIDEILKQGLHDYLGRFFDDIAELGNRISRDFLVPLAA
jgi:uncharacterized alpha-E superfamily protein